MTMVANANSDFSDFNDEADFEPAKSKGFQNNFVIADARPKKKFRKVVWLIWLITLIHASALPDNSRYYYLIQCPQNEESLAMD